MSEQKTANTTNGSKLMRYGMMACCAVMLLPFAGYFLAGGGLAGIAQNSTIFLPLLICVGAHLVMHKMMGKSCHTNSKNTSQKMPATPITEHITLEPQSQSR